MWTKKANWKILIGVKKYLNGCGVFVRTEPVVQAKRAGALRCALPGLHKQVIDLNETRRGGRDIRVEFSARLERNLRTEFTR